MSPEPLTQCENCGAPLAGEFCAQCGQQAIDYRRSLVHILADAADSFFNWDAKFFRSIGVLLAKPWRLTNDFNAGRRARYVHPLRLYLLASISFFLIVRAFTSNGTVPIEIGAGDRAELASQLEKFTGPESPLNPEARARVEVLREKISRSDGQVTVDERREIKAAVREVMKSTIRQSWSSNERAKIRQTVDNLPVAEAPPAPGDPATPPGEKKKIHFSWGGGGGEATPFQKWMEERIKSKVGEDGTKVTLFLDTLRSNIPTMMLFCIPAFALILKVLYLGSGRFYIEHLVYALHIHSFLFLGVGVILLLVAALDRLLPAFSGLAIGLLTLALTAQVFLSIARVYRQRWFVSLLKFSFGGVAYLVVLSLAIALTGFVTLLLPA